MTCVAQKQTTPATRPIRNFFMTRLESNLLLCSQCTLSRSAENAATGAKEVRADVCVGCKVCTIACPFGTINYSQVTGKVVKCDLCGGDPECAKACPTDAITGTIKELHVIHQDACISCGACFDVCPTDCIRTFPKSELEAEVAS